MNTSLRVLLTQYLEKVQKVVADVPHSIALPLAEVAKSADVVALVRRSIPLCNSSFLILSSAPRGREQRRPSPRLVCLILF